MKELISLKTNNERITVSARELHEYLESQERFSKWFERMSSYGLEAGIDFNPYQKVQVQIEGDRKVNRSQVDYQLTIDCAKEISMLQRSEKGKQARKYFIEAEKNWNSPEMIIKRALQIATSKVEQLELENLKKDQVIGELKPKADYVDKILKSKALVTVNQIAADYGLSAQKLNNILSNNKIQYKQSGQWLLYQKYRDKGFTKSETIQITRSNGSSDITLSTKWTQKGRIFIHHLLEDMEIYPTV